MKENCLLSVVCSIALMFVAGCHRSEPESRPAAPPPAERLRTTSPPAVRVVTNATPKVAITTAQPELPSPTPPPARPIAQTPQTTNATRPKQVAPRTNIVIATAPSEKPKKKKAQADALFDPPSLLRIEIEIPPAGVSALQRGGWGNGQRRPAAKVTVREDGVVYTNVAAHLKGSAGSFRGLNDKPALTLNFDKFAPEQSFHGLHKISLNNSLQDSSYLSEKICRELFIEAGVPAPRASHALVKLNGRDLGLYVLLEGANKQFLKRYFTNPDGNLYDGGFCQDIQNRLAINCGEDQNNNSGLKRLIAVARENRPDFDRLKQVLDVDRFASMLALEMVLYHWDGYSMNRNNWRVFHDLESNRMVFIPHGLDQMFGDGRQFDMGPLQSPTRAQGNVTRAFLSSREGQALYRERLRYVLSNVFKGPEMCARIDTIVERVQPLIAQTHPRIARSFQVHANSLKNRILRRAEQVNRELGVRSAVTVVQFGPEHTLQLKGWKPLVQNGDPKMEQSTGSNGEETLDIVINEGLCSSSWRTRAILGPGQYQLVGRLRTEGVAIEAGDTRGGAGLRISKGTMPRKITGSVGWTEFKYPFELQQQATDVEFLCELRGTEGQASFDANSLRVIQLR